MKIRLYKGPAVDSLLTQAEVPATEAGIRQYLKDMNVEGHESITDITVEFYTSTGIIPWETDYIIKSPQGVIGFCSQFVKIEPSEQSIVKKLRDLIGEIENTPSKDMRYWVNRGKDGESYTIVYKPKLSIDLVPLRDIVTNDLVITLRHYPGDNGYSYNGRKIFIRLPLNDAEVVASKLIVKVRCGEDKTVYLTTDESERRLLTHVMDETRVGLNDLTFHRGYPIMDYLYVEKDQ